ncbi:MAG: phage holin family protein [Bacteroidales bacterium]|jgi:phosphoglycerol transferase MdoB-like AlkP superfamily enzyme
MDGNKELFESLLESVTDYIKTNVELIKLKALDKASDGISSLISHSVVLVFVVTFLLFLNVGLAFWLGELLGSAYIGFFAVGVFYGLMCLIIRLFFHKRIKRLVSDYLIKHVLK